MTTTTTHDQETVDGRYVYCLVDTSSVSSFDVAVEGVNGRELSLVQSGDIGAVVHQSAGLYDTDDEAKIKRWLVEHQRAVDAASEVFGTPLPVRFDTVLAGEDSCVEDWLASHADTIREYLTSVRGCWEYRIQLRWDSEPFCEAVRSSDEELRELERRKRECSAGKRFMLQKQYSKRLRERVAEREAELQALLVDKVSGVAVEQSVQDATGGGSEEDGDDLRTVTEVSVLAAEQDEDDLGQRLDAVAEQRGVEIRFTGPWPPYTFAPELG